MFEYTTTIRLYDTDLGGTIFFTNQLKYAHDAFESFIESKGTSLSRLLRESPCAFPVVHAESDYTA
ncbi:MAG: acyl-CoA thioesterase, partial [Endomicrobiales bacterium]